jgi:hypothetical protein
VLQKRHFPHQVAWSTPGNSDTATEVGTFHAHISSSDEADSGATRALDEQDFATARTGLSCAFEQQPVVFICQETQPWDLAGTSLLNLL